MANNITLGKTYVPMLDEVYKYESKSSILDANEQIVKLAENGKDFLIPKMDMQGLGNTTRGGNYVEGDVSLEWQTKTPDYDRNRKFTVDSQDNQETSGLAFGMLSGEFIRTKVVPEIDSVRFAKYASKAGTTVTGAIANADAFLKALETATIALDDKEVPEEGRILFAPSSLLTPILQLDTTKSREILGKFSQTIKVPQNRFVSEITLKDGKSAGELDGGYVKATGAVDLNFMIINKSAIIQSLKHVAPKIISPDQNQSGDNWMYAYRVYAINETLDNKLAAIYVHKKAA